MAAFLIILCLSILPSLRADLFEPLEKKVSNKVGPGDCTKLSVEQCPQVAACVVSASACAPDPCVEYIFNAADDCSNSPAPGAPAGTSCVKYNTNGITMCLSSDRKDTVSSICSLEWGSYKIEEEGLCYGLSGCETATPIEGTDQTYYVCNIKPPVTDPCNRLTEEICPFVGSCMWEGGQCVKDSCWEKTATSADSCRSGCKKTTITDTPIVLAYCKNETDWPAHDLVSKCNAGTGTNVITKQVACSGYPAECKELVTINNYDGGTLYVCHTEELEFTVPDAALPLRISALALFAIILLAFAL